LREGSYGLECLLCRRHTKEHESILATEADASIIHAALLAAGAEPGAPVKYDENTGALVSLPRGTRIKVSFRYEDQGKLMNVPAQQWVRNTKTKKDMEGEWVFAGSRLYPHPEDEKKTVYGANSEGGFICIYNSPAALLDLPTDSHNKGPEEREYQPFTERIPPLETKVYIMLEANPDRKTSK
jgi:hypothetical protein